MPVRVVITCGEPDDQIHRSHSSVEPESVLAGYFRVEVIDHGVGIAAKDQGRVFGEFAQFNRNKLQGGGHTSPLRISHHFTYTYSILLRRVRSWSVDLQAHHRPAQSTLIVPFVL